MNVMRWKLKKLGAVLLLVIFILFWVWPRQYDFSADIKIPNAQPSDVWEYVADFSNMINLNPTM